MSTNSASRSPIKSRTNVSLSVLKFTGVSKREPLDVNDALSGRERTMASFDESTGELTSNISKVSENNHVWLLSWFMCSGAMYLGKMMFVMIPTPGKLQNMPDHGGNRTYDLWNARPMLCELSYAVRSVWICDISKLRLVLRGQRYLKCNHDFLVPKCQILGSTWTRTLFGRALG